ARVVFSLCRPRRINVLPSSKNKKALHRIYDERPCSAEGHIAFTHYSEQRLCQQTGYKKPPNLRTIFCHPLSIAFGTVTYCSKIQHAGLSNKNLSNLIRFLFRNFLGQNNRLGNLHHGLSHIHAFSLNKRKGLGLG